MNLLVSSGHPAGADVQPELVRLLCKAGASADGIANNRSPLGTALAFGYPAAARALVECGAKIDNIVYAAAVGNLEQVKSYFESTGRLKKDVAKCDFDWFGVSENPQTAAEQALVFASLCGEVKVVALLLDNGVDINAELPGSHMTATPLHTVAASGQESVTRLLTERGADPTFMIDQVEKIADLLEIEPGDKGDLIVTAMAAGWMGTSFSMLIGLKNRIQISSISDLKVIHRFDYIFSRALIGMISSLMLFYAFQSDILTGTFFPVFDPLNPQHPLDEKNTALLVIWSFISGFSEKLVPDLLIKTEQKVSQE